MKIQTDQKRCEVSFEVDDYVYLKLQPYKHTTVAFRGSLKLAPRFFGPFQILGKVGAVAYKLALLPKSQIHNAFHVSLLHKHLGPVEIVIPHLPPLSEASTILPQPEPILERRVMKKGKYRPQTEVLIKWQGAPLEDATWEKAWLWLRRTFLLSLRIRMLKGRGNDICMRV